MRSMEKIVRVHNIYVKLEFRARIIVHLEDISESMKYQVEDWFETASHLYGITKDIYSWKSDGLSHIEPYLREHICKDF